MGYIKKRIKNKLRILIDKLCDIEEMKRTLFYNTNKIEEISKQVSSNLEMQKKIDWFQYCNIYHNPFEYGFIKERWEGFEEYLTTENYQQLIEGMDSHSVYLINRTLNRIKKIFEAKGGPIDLYTIPEMEEMYYIKHNYLYEPFELADGNFVFKNGILPINHFEKGIFVDKHGIEKFARKHWDGAIIDVGAFIGDSAIVLSEYTSAKVYSFEALDQNYELLKKTIKLNRIDNIIPVNFALGNTTGKVSVDNLYEEIANGSCCVIRPNKDVDENSVKIMRLDDFVHENNIKCGLIKVDIEGAEQEFLQGAKETIASQHPDMILSIYHNPNDFFNIKRIIQEWVSGYEFKVFKPVDGTAVMDTVLLCEYKG